MADHDKPAGPADKKPRLRPLAHLCVRDQTIATAALMCLADKKPTHPGMMGDGTEEQNLGQTGNPAARITEDEVKEAFGKDQPAKPAK